MSKAINLTNNIEKLQEIASWFDEQTQIDVEEGLKKVKEAAGIIKESKTRLKEIENEFEEIQADIANEETEDTETSEETVVITKKVSGNDTDIPF